MENLSYSLTITLDGTPITKRNIDSGKHQINAEIDQAGPV